MFIKVKRALYSTSCIYSSHTHTITRTLILSCPLSCSPTQSGCLPAWQRGLQQQQQQRLQSNKHTVQDSNKKEEEGKAQRKRKKKTKAANWVGQGCQSGWVGALALGACLFLCRVVTAAASSFCSLLLLLPLPRSPSLLLRVASHFLH